VTAVLVAFAALVLLLFTGLPIGFGLAFVGLIAFAATVGVEPALNMLALTATDTVLNYNFSVLPLFVLMGSLFAHSKISDELYDAANAFIGHLRGGLSMATILACGGFSAISGSALACAITMSKTATPVMRREGYHPGFAAGTVAAGSTLDILIPPSTGMVLYALMTEVSLGKLMMAGFLPGVITILIYFLVIAVAATLRPEFAPAGRRASWRERMEALPKVTPIVALFVVVLGGIYLGVFTPTEAAGIGAAGSLLIAALRRKLSWSLLKPVLVETVRATSMLFIVLIGALLFANYVNVSGATNEIERAVATLNLSPTTLLTAIIFIYVALGCVLDATAMLVLTVPIFLPLILKAGIDPIYFGIIVIIVCGVGMLTPPMGLLLFVVRSQTNGVTTRQVFLGVLPFLIGDALRIALFVAVPWIILVVPKAMK
jgi:C4-dicarboxylate transporter DctM subunit